MNGLWHGCWTPLPNTLSCFESGTTAKVVPHPRPSRRSQHFHSPRGPQRLPCTSSVSRTKHCYHDKQVWARDQPREVGPACLLVHSGTAGNRPNPFPYRWTRTDQQPMSPPSFLELQRQQFPAVLPEGKCPVALSPRLASPPIPAGLHQQLQRSSPDRRRFCRSRIPYPEIPVPWLPQVAAAATSTRLAPNPSRSPRRLPHPAHHDRHGTPESDPAARPRMSCPVPPISTGFRFASRAHQKTRSAPARRTSAGRHLWNPPTFFCRRLLCAPGTPRFRPHAP